MHKKWFTLKQCIRGVILGVVVAGAMMCLSTTQASDIGKTRGHVTVDVSNFTLVESSENDTNNFGFNSENESNSRYKLFYKNSFTDRNNIGCTFRSSSTYDMTDVTGIQVYAKSSEDSDLLLVYSNANYNKYYHRIDNSELEDKDVISEAGDGIVWSTEEFECKKNENIHSRTCSISPRYSREYIFLGLSHSWSVHTACVYIDNKSIAADGSQGCVNLVLKEHKIELLEPEQMTRVEVDDVGTTKETPYNAFSNVRMKLENGQSYAPGETGSVYRDETITITYSLEKVDICSLSSFKFYEDKDKNKFLYEMNVTGQVNETGEENKATIDFNSDLIKKLEQVTGSYNLTDIYIEPVFKEVDTTVTFSPIVVEDTDHLEVALTKTNTNGSKEYTLREKTGSRKTIGIFYVNQAHQVGDEISIDFEPTIGYLGDYEFSYYEHRMCNSKDTLEGTSQVVTQPAENKTDIITTIPEKCRYFWIRAHVKLRAQVSLSNKTVTFNNQVQLIDEAELIWPEGQRKPTGKLTYHYYSDFDCQNELAKKDYPINAGTYYVTATLSQDDLYYAANSNRAVLTIQKATPVLSELTGENSITYGQAVSATNPVGIAKSVTNQDIDGTYTWNNSAYKPSSAGTTLAEITFTPSSVWLTNYTTATGSAEVTVDKATPTITVSPVTKVFDGKAVTNAQATVTGVNGEATGQKVSYSFYKTSNSPQEMNRQPVEAGTYYVSAYVSSNTNYCFKESDRAAVTITKRPCELIPVPVLSNNKYRVYVANAVNGYKPKGTITLSIVKDEVEQRRVENLAILEDAQGRYYAEHTFDVTGILAPFDVKAVYTEGASDNYTIASNKWNVAGESGTNHATVSMVYDGERKPINVADQLNSSYTTVRWLNFDAVNGRDIIDIGGTATEGTITIIPENAGTETLVAYVEKSGPPTQSWYLFYEIVVDPATVSVSGTDKTVTYSGEPVGANPLSETYEKYDYTGGVGIPQTGNPNTPVTYTYYSSYANSVLSGELEEEPRNVGTYYVQAVTEEQRNFKSAQCVNTITIKPANPVITLSDRTVTYDGQPQTLEEAIVKGVGGMGAEPSGTISYYYDSDALGYHSAQPPVNVGQYTVTEIYTPGNPDNYVQPVANRVTAKLTIEKAMCTVALDPMEMVYTGEAAKPNTLYFTGVDGQAVKASLEKIPGVNKWKDDKGNEYTFLYSSSVQMDYSAVAPTTAGLYYVYAVRTDGGNYKRAISDRSTLLIKPINTKVTIAEVTTTYTGNPVDMSALSPATVTNSKNEDITARVTVTYQYYKDEDGLLPIEVPTDAGIYYVQACAKNEPNYRTSVSDMKKLTIKKAVPVLSNLTAENLTYGMEIGRSQLTGTATGVKAESLGGTYIWAEAICHEKRAADVYNGLSIVFIPDEAAARNYTEADGTVKLCILPCTPQLTGADQTEIYNKEVQSLTPVKVVGPEGVPAPTGNVTYTYYTDEACSHLAPDSDRGVTDAGSYYCRVEYTSDSTNYTDVSATYKLEIKKVEAAIGIRTSTLGKNVTSGEIRVDGILAGVFDDPTGTVTIYCKAAEADDSEYLPMAVSVPISKLGDSYVFDTIFSITHGVYDVKAVYNEGIKQNYHITDGVLQNTDMSKDPQHIYFTEKLIVKEYGEGDFKPKLVDENNGTGEVSYKLITRIGNPEILTVSEDGNVHIANTGTAFVMATKASDSSHNAAYAIAAIRVVKAPVEIGLADKTVTYSGEPVGIGAAVLTSHGAAIAAAENIQVEYTYEHIATGTILGRQPVEAGVYRVIAHSLATECYCEAESTPVTLTIEKAKAGITLSADYVNEAKKLLTLEGLLPGVFDYPSGHITIYIRKSSQPESAYIAAAENVDIILIDKGCYGFEAQIPVELDQTYDFMAVYDAEEISNYIITDGYASRVVIQEIIDRQNHSGGNGGAGADGNDGTPNGGAPNGGAGADGSSGAQNGGNSGAGGHGADTSDTNIVFGCLLMLIAAVGMIVITGRRTRR